jgi:diguanylate cyclase (GGDEF)-like protein
LRSCIQQEVFAQGATTVRVTISVGYAGTEAVQAEAFDDLLRAADKALYAAKLSGRNRVLAYQPESIARAVAGSDAQKTGSAKKLR